MSHMGLSRRFTIDSVYVRFTPVVSSGRRNTLSQTQGMEWTAMDRRYARGFNAAAREELWERWRHGESLKAIGRAFGKPSSSIYFQVAPHGGIRPARRRRSRLALTLSEREEISRGIAAARSIRSMARLLGRAPSTVSREIGRNGDYDRYRATSMRGRALVVRSVASWPTMRGYDSWWRANLN